MPNTISLPDNSTAVVAAFNRGIAVAHAVQIDTDLYWIADDLEIEPEMSDAQPVLVHDECGVVVTAGDVRRGRLDGEVITTSKGTISFLVDARISVSEDAVDLRRTDNFL